MAAKATPAKLRDGSWGARTTERVVTGSSITVTTRGGKSWTTTVSEVVWSDGSACIVRTGRSSGGSTKRSRKPRGWNYGTKCRIDGTGDAWEQ